MKAVLGWILDPYVDILIVALILLRLAVGVGAGEEQVDTTPAKILCRRCDADHEFGKCSTMSLPTKIPK